MNKTPVGLAYAIVDSVPQKVPLTREETVCLRCDIAKAIRDYSNQQLKKAAALAVKSASLTEAINSLIDKTR